MPSLGLALALLAATATAHGEPTSTTFDMPIPSDPMSGQIIFATMVGPDDGLEVLHATYNLEFTSPPGGTPGSDIDIELGLSVDGTTQWFMITGADLGWPSTTGTFQGSIGSDVLNGVLDPGLFGFATGDLHIQSTTGGVTGQFTNSYIQLELAGEFCQTDLGFGGPGLMRMEICGEPLGTGQSAELLVTRAPASSPVFLALSLTSNPTPFYGGLLVPLPLLSVLTVPSDATGTIALPVPGGSGPLTVYVQAVAEDAGAPLGYVLSNALEVELLP